MKLRHLVVLVNAVMLVPVTVAAQQQRAMTLVDLLNVPRLTDPQLSPDGRQVLYVLAEADWKANKRISHIWRINVDGTGQVQLTSGAKGETSPRWSPDGNTVAFLTQRGDDDATQIYLISGGAEARPVTDHPTGISSITWSPDSRSIYFLARDAKSDEEKARDKAQDDVYSFDENYKQQHLWKISVADRVEQRITQGDYSVLEYDLSQDGRRVVFHKAPNPLLGSADEREVWVMDATGQAALQLTRNQVPETGAELSPDGSRVLFLAGTNDKFEKYYNRNIFIIPAGGGAPRILAADLPYEVEQANWSRDGRSIFFVANLGVHSELFQLDPAGGQPRQLTDGQHAIGNWSLSPSADRHVVTIDEAANPGDVWLIPAGGGQSTRVTRVFDYLAREFRLPRQEKVSWKGADGTTVEGMLYYPLDYQSGQKYPLAVQTHGGPQSSDKFGFGSSSSYIQVLTAKGYVVLKPNYRGSTGYGDPFLRDMVGGYYTNSHLDVMTGVDHLIKLGIADGERMVKMGWSGGGHMTNKIVTFTTRFKAASAGAGASNWVSMYAQSDTRTNRTSWFGGTPWQENAPIEVYWEHSPLKYVYKVRTPTIILVGENDERVPAPQSVEMYRGLKSNGVPTHLYIAPREPHGWQEMRHQLFKMNVELDWFEKHATKRPYVWEKAPEEPAKPRTTTTPN